ncbi:hypothetical protein M0R45_017819 [Rubus argutus]|uniref:Uncharacterized protein n=1 Tax=Rubus argutus TaxID=59490 RepID=A0AAW1XYR1_RUBAR
MQESEVVTRTGLVLLIDDDGNGEEERVDELADQGDIYFGNKGVGSVCVGQLWEGSMLVRLQKESSLELFRWVWFSLKGSVLAFTDEVVLSARLVFDALRELGNGATDKCEPPLKCLP